MLGPMLVFVLVVAVVLGGYLAANVMRDAAARRRLEVRLQEVAQPGVTPDESVVLRPTDSGAPATEAELLAFCKERLADFKRPKQIHITDVIPRTATGKIQRRLVAEAFSRVAS